MEGGGIHPHKTVKQVRMKGYLSHNSPPLAVSNLSHCTRVSLLMLYFIVIFANTATWNALISRLRCTIIVINFCCVRYRHSRISFTVKFWNNFSSSLFFCFSEFTSLEKMPLGHLKKTTGFGFCSFTHFTFMKLNVTQTFRKFRNSVLSMLL